MIGETARRVLFIDPTKPCFDHLLSLRPVVSTGYGPSSVKELTDALREVERTRKGQRESLFSTKMELRKRGMKAYELP